MHITMPESALIMRIAKAAPPPLPLRTRLDVSAEIGLDVSLVLGPVSGDADELAEYTRLCALVDMADAGFIPAGDELDKITIDLLAGLIEEIEREDDARGYEADEMVLGGWAA
ncbi:hypothetical protein [Streptomyces klenkii]